ncbi:MAG: TonB-dependent receptor [Caulobacteraceae bacterium]|nr:TonB-dependent receptor [Caulobacteraceae bacterium]
MGWSLKRLLISSAPVALALNAAPVVAAAADATANSPNSVSEVVVTAQRLDAARDTIQPQVGASTYSLSSQAIANLPAGENTPLNQVILQAPGVAQDSYGQLHIRGEHNGLQYRLNGVILPEGLSVFSQALSPRIAGNVELITGALPAEYGLRTAGIIDVTTKSGAFANGGSVTVYGGSHGDIEPSFEAGGSSGNFNYFVSGSYLQNDLGIESPDGRSDPLHDHTRQYQGFAYLEDILDSNSRLSLILGSSNQTFQIPDVSGGLNGGFGYVVNGQTNYPSEALNENQDETSQYAVLSYLHTSDRLTIQASLFGRYSTLKYTPDIGGDILYDGIAQFADKKDVAGGLQLEGAYHLNDQHTVRAGVIVEVDRSTSDTTSQVLLLDATTGEELAPTAPYAPNPNGLPFTIVDNTGKTAETYSAYIQDEWKLLDNLTLNYGLRFDQFDGYRDENQVSPRVNLVWLPDPSTTIHIGYARYFTPPPFELIANETVQKFASPVPTNANITTSAAPAVAIDTTPFAERANYFDVGVAQKVGQHLTLTVDGYYKLSKHLIDEGQFGAPIILTPFNYEDGRQYGVELSATYAQGPFSAYANFAYSVAQGEDWISSQFNFGQTELDYVANHYIYLDHDQRYSVSAGASYLWAGTRFGADLIYGSGLRASLPLTTPIPTPDGPLTDIPNGAELPGYVQVNFSVSHRFEDVWGKPLEVRFDVINAFDAVYQIRNGTGVGVFAPQYGPRRGFFFGVTKDF